MVNNAGFEARPVKQPAKQALICQEGFILPWVIMVILLGAFIAVPVIELAGNAFRGHSRLEDQVRSFYAADAIVHAIISDLDRGALSHPLPFRSSSPGPWPRSSL
ncbi:MAG: hypothetical protein HW388_1303 [Dehalococcoidia bacterium]|nr:hypothetical protein [Dehalococcoidia bacterium]